jgi:mRNA-degrading endonuclease RelE of RelBE toxin-antitoxin system
MFDIEFSKHFVKQLDQLSENVVKGFMTILDLSAKIHSQKILLWMSKNFREKITIIA